MDTDAKEVIPPKPKDEMGISPTTLWPIYALMLLWDNGIDVYLELTNSVLLPDGSGGFRTASYTNPMIVVVNVVAMIPIAFIITLYIQNRRLHPLVLQGLLASTIITTIAHLLLGMWLHVPIDIWGAWWAWKKLRDLAAMRSPYVTGAIDV